MPVNPSTASTVAAGVGVGVFGLVQWVRSRGEAVEERQQAKHPTSEQESKSVPFARTILGQTCCATVGGWFQVYSGGIAIDTVATRLQAGLSPSRALWGVEREALKPKVGQSMLQLRWQLLAQSNLFAGHFVTMLSRFPYLCLNFNSYAQMEQYLLARSGKAGRPKTMLEEFACISFATVISSTAICAAECPKILDQLKMSEQTPSRKNKFVLQEGPETVTGVIRKYGYRRLMQGYSACFCREILFNAALLGSPFVAVQLREKFVKPELDSSKLAASLDGNEEMAAACLLGVSLGFITNAPDQLKTNIQKGQFLNMREALAWQIKQPGGLAALFGRSAVWRAMYIAHAVIAVNFARSKVEVILNALYDSQKGVGQAIASLVGLRRLSET